MALWGLFTESFKSNSDLLKAEPLPCCPRGTCEYEFWVHVFLTLRKQIPLSLLIAPKTASKLCFKSLSCRPGFSWSPQNSSDPRRPAMLGLSQNTPAPHLVTACGCNHSAGAWPTPAVITPPTYSCNIHLHCWISFCFFLQVWIYRQPFLLLLL